MKQTSILLSFLATGLLFSACSRHGHKSAQSNYAETNLGNGSYSVEYKGGKHTNATKASDLCLYRCAQLAKENSYDYFTISQSQSDSIINATQPANNSKTVKFVREKTDGDNAYESNMVIQTIGAKYHLKINEADGSIHSSPWE